MSIPHIYILSGLGADERAFQNLDLDGFEHTFLAWISPEKNETIAAYALRIGKEIRTKSPIIIGLSFGGMVAVELAKHLPVQKLILISSAKTRKEIPWIYHIAGKFFLHKIIPISWMQNGNFLSNWLFGTTTSSDKSLLKRILQDTDPEFVKWSINAVINWKNTTIPPNTLHIHGTRDRILPIHNIKCDIEIQNGGHFMLVNRSQEISEIVRRHIQSSVYFAPE